ncbi:PadR family transcriptional regulator [Luteimicrobium subarcticum]|uniref:PadR family transcriptional regulator n=1 Tax=Luteimicrobium subarcticum TaxID=620910 RepID=A0A2M8WQN8_9MICO|nr:PadR family transcriptional regulator [Luteimicrobium subarcticum]PJI93227.1 PadR family transcriptional regulator [Luteimicrobium subarcticum]
MSIRQAMLALLDTGPMHGYQLRQEFEGRTGGTWPLNIGQAYTTLQRLQRDGLVEPLPSTSSDEPERFQLTDSGRTEARAWWHAPVERGAPARDELAIKLALAVTLPGVDVEAIVRVQRTESMRALQDYTRLKRRGPDRTAGGVPDGSGHESPDTGGSDLAWTLVLDALIFQTEAEMRWLDHVEGRVLAARTTARRTPPSTGQTSAAAATGSHATPTPTPTPRKARR